MWTEVTSAAEVPGDLPPPRMTTPGKQGRMHRRRTAQVSPSAPVEITAHERSSLGRRHGRLYGTVKLKRRTGSVDSDRIAQSDPQRPAQKQPYDRCRRFIWGAAEPPQLHHWPSPNP